MLNYKKWSLGAKLATISAAFGILVALLNIYDRYDTSIRSEEFFKVALELRYNHEHLLKLIQYNHSDSHAPYGSLKTDALLVIMHKHFDLITRSSYGEQKHLYQLSLLLKDIGARLEKVENSSDLRILIQQSELSLEDVLFLNDFIFWYLSPFLNEELSNHHKLAFSPFDIPNNETITKLIDINKLRYFNDDGEPISNFIDYLGLID